MDARERRRSRRVAEQRRGPDATGKHDVENDPGTTGNDADSPER